MARISTEVMITGFGVLAPFGVGADILWYAIHESVNAFAVRPLSGAWHSQQIEYYAGYLRDELPETILGPKNLRTLSRESQFATAAAACAFHNAGIVSEALNKTSVGVVLGTMFSGLHSFSESYSIGMRERPDYVNPALTPETGFNAPASHISIRFQTQGPNLTVSAGAASSLEAIRCAEMELTKGRCEIALAGGVDVLCHAYAGARSGETSMSFRQPRPFDRDRFGPVYSEAAAFLVLEDSEHVRGRSGKVVGCLENVGVGYCPPDHSPLRETAEQNIRETLERASVRPREVDAVLASANGDPEMDREESIALHRIFGPETPVFSIKGATGECFGAAGALQMVVALLCMQHDIVLGTVGFSTADPALPPLAITRSPFALSLNRILIHSMDPGGFSGCAVLRAAS